MTSPNCTESGAGTIDGRGMRTVAGMPDEPALRCPAPDAAGGRPTPRQNMRIKRYQGASDDPARGRRPWLDKVFD
jgi:hypothetical protein